jgi:hypothetical protein
MKSLYGFYDFVSVVEERSSEWKTRAESQNGNVGYTEATMLRRTNVVWIIVVTAVLVASWVMFGTARAQKAAVPKPPDKLELGDAEVRQLLLLMDTDKNGKISKKEWMTFMEAEFDRLDKDKSGDLDVKDLAQSRLRVSHPVSMGK